MDKSILKRWLEAGYMENKKLHQTVKGTPQGGIISPTLLVLTLAGLQKTLADEFREKDRIKIVSYADDFIITSAARIGIGTQNPTETIDVVGLPSIPPDLGDIRVEGMLKTDQVCDAGSASCFNPILITGTEDAMECDADDSLYGNQAVVKLANSQVSCASAVNSASVPIEGETLRVDTTVISGNPEYPHQWYMSRQADIFDYGYLASG